jgi:hypothetical protein
MPRFNGRNGATTLQKMQAEALSFAQIKTSFSSGNFASNKKSRQVNPRRLFQI